MASGEDKQEKSSRCGCGWLDFNKNVAKKFIDDSSWQEVCQINNYAVFMGYLSMGVRGLGFLVVTWTTVVLLGGFVSTIKRKDFWCLTVIVLTETAGIFDIFLKEKLSHISYAVNGLASASFARTNLTSEGDLGEFLLRALLHFVVATVKAGIQLVVLTVILTPLAVIYISGIYVSTAISVWRLIQHDYGNNTDEDANMKPALDVLYSLAVVQGVVYGYRASYSSARKDMVELIIRHYKFDRLAGASVWKYLEDTMSGCEKDPTFARGRNLITYAVDLMESNSPDNFISGVRIVDTMSSNASLELDRHTLIKHMIGSSSSSPVLQKLLQALGTRNPWNIETRGRAARIVKHLAREISLEQFPRGIQDISCLIGTFIEYNDLSLNGMGILGILATDENNARIISSSQGLVSQIMAPVTSDLLHNFDHDHDAWSRLVEGSLEAMRHLVFTPGEAGAKMRRDILGNAEVISSMIRILHCPVCFLRKELPLRILTRLYMDTQVTQDFIKLLLQKFDRGYRHAISSGHILEDSRVAGQALALLSSTGTSNAMIILQANDDVVSNLSKQLLDVDRLWSRNLAAKILENLCIHCTMDDKCLDKLEEAMIDVMSKLLGEIFPEEATETGRGAGFSSSEADIEGQHGGASQANDLNKSASASKIKKSCKVPVALLSFYLTVCETFISADPDKACQFSAIYESSLPRKLRAMVEGTSEPTANNLRTLKLISAMVISMVKHEGSSSYRKQDLQSLMEALSIASKNLVRVDGSTSMYSSSGDGDGAVTTRMTTKTTRSLASLVKEAKEIVSKYHNAEESEILELSTYANKEIR